MTGYVFAVELGHVVMFARAIGDPDPAYEAGAAVPPTFVQAAAHFEPDYPHRPRLGEPWKGSGRDATGDPSVVSSGRLHAEQHYEYGEPVRPGEVLRVESFQGRTWEKVGRSGPLVFSETITEFRHASGALAVRSRAVSVVTAAAR